MRSLGSNRDVTTIYIMTSITMKTWIRYSILSVLTSLLFAGQVFGYNDTDCPLVELYYTEDGDVRTTDNGWNGLFNSSNEYIQNILKNEKTGYFPKDNVVKAIDNLRGYCCSQ